VFAFQQQKSLLVDGIVGPQTWSALIITVKQGSSGDAVRGVQQEFQFRNLSGDPSKGLQIDGIFGPKTDAAVRGFQKPSTRTSRRSSSTALSVRSPGRHSSAGCCPCRSPKPARLDHSQQPTGLAFRGWRRPCRRLPPFRDRLVAAVGMPTAAAASERRCRTPPTTRKLPGMRECEPAGSAGMRVTDTSRQVRLLWRPIWNA
jgi:peptidoglycan hydrolase-like protein with peptidoglycan-binding domain